MIGPKQMAEDLGTLTEAWNRLAPNDQFTGLTLEQFKAEVKPALDARAQLAQTELDYQQHLAARTAADDTANTTYKRVVYGIRAHPSHGDNSGLLRALGYVMESERGSGLTRKGATTTGTDGVVSAPPATIIAV